MANYEATVEIKIFGRSQIAISEAFEVFFAIGSRAYVKKQAEKGIFETVIIKKINRRRPHIQSGVVPVVSYVDNTNRVWIEDELIDEEDAFVLYHVYWTRIKRMAEELLQYPNL